PDRERPGERRTRRGPQGEPDRRFKLPLWYLLAGVALVLVIHWAATGMRQQEISYGRFRQLLAEGRVSKVVLTSDKARGELVEPLREGGSTGFVATRAPSDDKLAELLQEKLGDNGDVERSWLESPLLYWLLPLVLIFLVWRLVLGRSSAISSVMDFSQSRAQLIAQKEVGVTFDDVAGIEECKQELEEVVEFLRNPSKFTRLGGRIPKGVLLVGPPGTGKTLLAKAVAGEAEVTFFSLSGSDFVEMFVGVGAARVRDLFEQATRSAPSIIFIDELDALGKTRGAGLMGGHDEREQTLNALLVQMDGFTTQKGVILLAATNRPEMLDPALLRPGRFDRQIVVPPPDLRDRKDILRVHAAAVKLSETVDLQRLAAMTPGFVGADLANLVNEATLLAARRGKDAVDTEDFEDSIERVVAGLEKRNRLMNEVEKDIVAHHEAGHALLGCLLEGTDPVRKVSMIPRGLAALGYTMQMPTEDRYLLRKRELLDRLTMMLGGRSAEEVVFGEISTGAQNDLQKATELAREMVMQFGMSEELGPLSYSPREGTPWQSEISVQKPWSERTARQLDRAIRSLVDTSHQRAVQLLTEHKAVLLALASAVRENEVLDEEELREILARHDIDLPPRGKGRQEAGEPVEGPAAGVAEEGQTEPAPDSMSRPAE
ncbi:MAG: ATP-dependent zinc metalloprotease FtsH, partial [Planctomycetota bacterium]